jgi:hypothetical protein
MRDAWSSSAELHMPVHISDKTEPECMRLLSPIRPFGFVLACDLQLGIPLFVLSQRIRQLLGSEVNLPLHIDGGLAEARRHADVFLRDATRSRS